MCKSALESWNYCEKELYFSTVHQSLLWKQRDSKSNLAPNNRFSGNLFCYHVLIWFHNSLCTISVADFSRNWIVYRWTVIWSHSDCSQFEFSAPATEKKAVIYKKNWLKCIMPNFRTEQLTSSQLKLHFSVARSHIVPWSYPVHYYFNQKKSQ